MRPTRRANRASNQNGHQIRIMIQMYQNSEVCFETSQRLQPTRRERTRRCGSVSLSRTRLGSPWCGPWRLLGTMIVPRATWRFSSRSDQFSPGKEHGFTNSLSPFLQSESSLRHNEIREWSPVLLEDVAVWKLSTLLILLSSSSLRVCSKNFEPQTS